MDEYSFKIDDVAPASEWFFGDVGDWSQSWNPDSFDEFWLRTVGIDPL